MKEQWKKHDSDAKLLQNVEEGRPQPIKIELPISAFGLKQDNCCNKLIKLLRIAVLFVLLLILSWTAVTLYSNYYPRQLIIDENTEQLVSNQHDYSSEENKLSFRNKVYAMPNEQDNAASNDIDAFVETSTYASIAPSTLSMNNGFDVEKMRALLEFLQMENSGGIRVIKVVLSPEDKHTDELQNIENDSLESNIRRSEDYFKERFYLEDLPKLESVNEEDVFPIDQQVDAKFFYPDKKFDSEVPIEEKVEESGAEENESIEDIVIPSLEVEDTQTAVQDLENDMENAEVDDLQMLVNDIAYAMGLLEEPSSEVDQLNAESVAVIQEEIKNNEEKLEVVDLDKVSSTEEKSSEESVAVVQEAIKDDDEGAQTIYSVELEAISEEEEPNSKIESVSQERIKNDYEESSDEEDEVVVPLEIIEEKESDYFEDDNSKEKSQEKSSSEDTSLDDLAKNIINTIDLKKLLEQEQADKTVESISEETKSTVDYLNESVNQYEYQLNQVQEDLMKVMKETGKEYDNSEEKFLETTEKLEERIEEDNDSNESFRKIKINQKFFQFLAKKLEPIVGPHFELIRYSDNTQNRELEETQDNLSAYTAKLLFEVDVATYIDTLNIVSRLIMDDSNTLEYEKIVADEVDITPETFMQYQIFSILKIQLNYYNEWKSKGSSDELYDMFSLNMQLFNTMFRTYYEIANKLSQARIKASENESTTSPTQTSSEEFLPQYQSIIEAMKQVGEEYEQTEKSAEETTVLVFKNYDETEESAEETAASTFKNNDDDDGDGDGLKEEITLNSAQSESSNTNVDSTEELKPVFIEPGFVSSDESLQEEQFMKFLAQYVKNGGENEEDLPFDDPYDY